MLDSLLVRGGSREIRFHNLREAIDLIWKSSYVASYDLVTNQSTGDDLSTNV